MLISKSAAKRMIRNAGAARVGDDAAAEFANMINRFAYSIASKAVKLAAHAKRKTVEKSDIKLAR